ncbi:MAG TPA: cysteine desulfurase-like protein [Acidimicrobiales bacterium]|nr:cysteine desulfurase-like protein [Acidimicrobiales bacterium]
MQGSSSSTPGYDVASIRSRFPALADGFAYLDGAAGTLVPASVIEAITAAHRSGLGNVGGAFPASRRSGDIVAEARRAVADLVGGDPGGVVFGPNMTTLTYRMSQALAKTWRGGDVVVVSRLDHDANVRPWVQAAERAGVEVRWAEVELATGELPVAQYDELIGEGTRLVAVSAASNCIGTRPDVAAIAARAHAAGALVYVDGVHATPHGPVDVVALGADFYVTSAYKWAGPHIGALVASPALLEELHPDKLAPSSDLVPGRFEWGTSSFADLAGVTAAVEHLANLDASAQGSRRERVLASMAASERHELTLLAELLEGLEAMAVVTTYGKAPRRAATAFFNVAGHSPGQVAEHLAACGVNVWNGDNYAYELTRALGLRQTGGAVRAGLVHYSDRSDVQRLLEGLDSLA